MEVNVIFEFFLEYEMTNIHECEIATFDYAKNDECCYASENVLRPLWVEWMRFYMIVIAWLYDERHQ